jgi:hypothetical protein
MEFRIGHEFPQFYCSDVLDIVRWNWSLIPRGIRLLLGQLIFKTKLDPSVLDGIHSRNPLHTTPLVAPARPLPTDALARPLAPGRSALEASAWQVPETKVVPPHGEGSPLKTGPPPARCWRRSSAHGVAGGKAPPSPCHRFLAQSPPSCNDATLPWLHMAPPRSTTHGSLAEAGEARGRGELTSQRLGNIVAGTSTREVLGTSNWAGARIAAKGPTADGDQRGVDDPKIRAMISICNQTIYYSVP